MDIDFLALKSIDLRDHDLLLVILGPLIVFIRCVLDLFIDLGTHEMCLTLVVVSYGIRDNEVSKAVYQDFLPRALAEGKFIPARDPHVVG